MGLLVILLAFFKFADIGAHVILIDPGHGGEETGAIGRLYQTELKEKKMPGEMNQTINIYEKDLALEYAQTLKKKLSLKHTVFLTRSHDRKISLEERAKLASQIKADLYISIHFNSSNDSSVQGFEIYYLNNHQDKAVKKLEDYENLKFTNQAVDKEITEILLDLVINKTVVSSKDLAQTIHKNLNNNSLKKFKIKDRGVKAGLFHVLALAQIPGVLIEVGFLSNREELKKLQSKDVEQNLMDDVADAIENYLNKKT